MLGAKIEEPLVPFGEDFDYVVPPGICGRWPQEGWLEVGFQEFISFSLYFQLEIIRHFGPCWFW
jgi:hypothetical protein